MSTDDPAQRDDLNESDIASARLSPPTRHVDRHGDGDGAEQGDEHGDGHGDGHGDVLTGGDAKRAPHSLSEAERRPMTGDSSGTSWDDPDEL
ncbi:hypothetical protein [Cellulosimicrobium arenosum]|uniref:Uncharacterized protein n=1 Tax=Cellulosimicrobium arenosum TaxID=2708133 RepID=A0A927G7T3_9MICO|nr:hypothetical protein [Cellulosimicrobium arenosum]MBD8077940.1 hypothetical protein [Cellulosimicrobium arenosum]